MIRRSAAVACLAVVSLAACQGDAPLLAPTSPQLAVVAGGEKQWAVVFNQPNGLPQNVNKIVADAGGTITGHLAEIGSITVASANPDFAANMAGNPQVKFVEEDIEVLMIPGGEDGSEGASLTELALAAGENGQPGPAEPAGPDPQPGMDKLYNQQWDKMRMNASATGSYAVQRGRKEVVVGVLDTGAEIFPVPHPDIAPNLDFARSRSFLNRSFGVQGDPNPARWDDKNGHGSWCLSAVGAPINVVGISGVAPGVTLVALKVLNDLGSGSFTGIARALIYAGNNKFDVASMSIGGYLRHANGGQGLVTILQRAVEFARASGVTPIAALGNDNFNLADGAFFRDFIEAPAEIPGVIGVSATTYTNSKAFYSNYGVGKTDVSAPGGGSTTFDPMPPVYHGFGRVLGAYAREAIGSIRPDLREEQCEPGPGGACSAYAWIRGTSMATPNAAGVAALIISQYGDFTPDGSRKLHMSPTRVESILQQTANNQACVDNGPYPGGFSIYDAQCQGGAGGYTSFFGKGIVDALKAVTSGGGS